MTEQQRAVLMMTPDQIHATWIREQEWKRGHGKAYYSALRDVATDAIVATVPK